MCRAVVQLSLVIFSLIASNIALAQSGAGEVRCPTVIASRQSGLYYPRSRFRCFTDVRSAVRRGYDNFENRILPADASGAYSVGLVPRKRGCNRIVSPKQFSLSLGQTGKFISATASDGTTYTGFRLADRIVLSRSDAVACNDDGVPVTAQILTTLTLKDPIRSQFGEAVMTVEHNCDGYCVDELVGDAERQ